jgi:hypothetical protein
MVRAGIIINMLAIGLELFGEEANYICGAA